MQTQEQFVRNFSTMENGEVDFFLGAGASIASGIPTGSDLIWEFKRTLFCSECNVSIDKYKDLALPSTQKKLQDYFQQKQYSPLYNAPEEYSFYFERCYSSPLARKRFIETLVSGKSPSLGYLCLAAIILNGKIKNVWTTNFDSLLEKAIHIIDPLNDILVCSEANLKSVDSLNPQIPIIGKLHGDYRFDWLRNTRNELQQLEKNLKRYAATQLVNKQLVVIGYSGNDESIMSFLEDNIKNPSFLSKGLLWTIKKNTNISSRVKNLLERFTNSGKPSEIIEIDSFESLMYAIYCMQNYHNETIDNKKKAIISRQEIKFSGTPIDYFVKLNCYKSIKIPSCNIFDTDITSWKELREVISTSDIIVALFNGKIYSFSSEEKLQSVFKQHILSNITTEEVSKKILLRDNSIYFGLIYDLIEKTLILKGLKKIRKNKFYNPNTLQNDIKFQIYDAIEIVVNYYDGILYLNLLPTVHLCYKNGSAIEKESYRFQINRIISKIYNSQYNEKLKSWEKFLRNTNKIQFENDGFTLSFITPAVSCGGSKREANWPLLTAFTYKEPIMCFSDKNQAKLAINQLKGLCKFGPLDYSYARQDYPRPAIRLAVLSPQQDMKTILLHLNRLNSFVSNNKKDFFLTEYEGFNKVFRRSLLVPSELQKNICIGYDRQEVLQKSPSDFLAFMKRGIEYYSNHSLDFDVLIIYIPNCFADYRFSTTISLDFNLHDALKLYATEKGIRIQLIEEKSINAYDSCKVMWGLSTSLYAKATGILWQPEAIQNDTAYIGISYAISKEKGICIGCSQLFDSTGTGVRMILRKIDNPILHGKNNPYMRINDARIMMTELREQYYQANPVNSLKRIVIHKTTPFINEEISGIMQAFCGIDDIELIQIQDYSSWRGIRFGAEPSHTADNYAIKRGLVIKIDKDNFLLWTHGCIVHPELNEKLNYYKGGRGIPSPLLVKRFAGNTDGDIIAKEILMLTKMNWNSGDSLYKNLPVTLDFAKVLARMSKQDEAIFNKAYDFRFFM